MSLIHCAVRDEPPGGVGVPSHRPFPLRHRWETLRQRVGELAIQLADDPDVEAASWRLPANALSPSRARRLTRDRLTAWGMEDQADTAELLVSELVTNVLRHTCCAGLVLRLSAVEGLLRCEVEDDDGAMPKPTRHGGDDEHGRGLWLLNELTCCWGAERTRRGKVTWFELPPCDPR